MKKETQIAINARCEAAASRLQREKYAMTGLTRKQFIPCPRGIVYTSAMYSGRVMSEIENEVILTTCQCHPGFDLDKCYEYEYPQSAAALLGSMTSERKAAASRRNGRKGGRPRKDAASAATGGA